MFKGCLNWNYFLNDGLDIQFDIKTCTIFTFNKVFKKGLKALKKKVTKAVKGNSGGPAEDVKAMDE